MIFEMEILTVTVAARRFLVPEARKMPPLERETGERVPRVRPAGDSRRVSASCKRGTKTAGKKGPSTRSGGQEMGGRRAVSEKRETKSGNEQASEKGESRFSARAPLTG